MREMSRKCVELLGDDEDTANEEINNDNSSHGVNKENNNNAIMVSISFMRPCYSVFKC